MSGVRYIEVGREDEGQRLDRWFRHRYPALGRGRLEKLLREGQIRVDGGRVRSGTRLEVGQRVRVPPLREGDGKSEMPKRPVRPDEAAALRDAILYRDGAVLAINKPPGLAVQGGSGTFRHLDRMLDALAFGGERPRLVHRLDKDTSGVLVLARSARAASALTRAFRARAVDKIYWALVVGIPKPGSGRIDHPILKRPGPKGERVETDEGGKPAVTLYQTIDTAGRRAAWLALKPLTGRTHQLRAHLASLGTPILGDGKYGGAAAFLSGSAGTKLHLHARSVTVPPLASVDGAARPVTIIAPLPPHMAESWRFFGFDEKDEGTPFSEPFP